MNSRLYVNCMLPVIMLLLAAFYLAIAFRSWRFNRPFLMARRWMLGFMVVAFSPSFLNPFIFHSFSHHASHDRISLLIIQGLNPLIAVILLIFFWFVMQGYVAFAVTENSFREAFLVAAAKLGYTCEEKLSTMHLMPVDATIQVAIQGWIGSGSLRSKSRAHAPVLDSLAKEINAYWASQGGETNRFTTALYALFGLVMLALAIALALLKAR